MELFSLPVSTYSAKVRIALGLKNITCTISPPPGGYSTAEYMQLVPLGTIPALRVGDEYFSESDVIMEYLEDAYPAHSLLTDDQLKRARHRFLARYHDLWLEPHLRRTFAHCDPATRVQAELDDHLNKFEERLAKLDELFTAQPFMVDKNIGYADCAFPATIELADILLPLFGRELKLGPNMTAWRAAVLANPVVKSVTDESRSATLEWMNSGGG
ncbi:glutathione S-transferase family protein [Aliamphritea hakodatensis]|uniref:glutathione S-transferase family protein n=1 Tax=Aliamphritea hakodatensis TaxID=2895352 RepID=UPI0022FD863A|nr:glutathione S-transferase family protein [Aliamphritea hakodatensis]